MPQKYYNVKETARILGIPEDDVKQMQANRELHGYRDGIDWKFKVEDIDRMAEERASQPAAEPDAGQPDADQSGVDESDVLLSELELGVSDPGASGTVIGMEGPDKSYTESDLQLADNGSQQADSGLNLADEPEATSEDKIGSQVTQFEDLDLTLEEDLTLGEDPADAVSDATAADSDIGLDGAELEDDDLVLGGSSAGSDITIGGDSGISLVDPADSGLSLEEPLELAQSEESLELGEDEMFSLSDDTDTEAPAELKAEDEFLLDTLEVTEDEDDSDSGSQVIALDDAADDAAGDMADDMAGDMAGDAAATIDNTPMAGILEEDLDAEPNELGLTDGLDAAATGSPLGPQPGVGTAGEPSSQAAASMPETPYSIWNILSLALCVIFLVMTGMMMSDLLRNMWSWDSAYEFNSTIMDTILGWFE